MDQEAQLRLFEQQREDLMTCLGVAWCALQDDLEQRTRELDHRENQLVPDEDRLTEWEKKLESDTATLQDTQRKYNDRLEKDNERIDADDGRIAADDARIATEEAEAKKRIAAEETESKRRIAAEEEASERRIAGEKAALTAAMGCEDLADLRKKMARVDAVDNVEQSYRTLLADNKKIKGELSKLKSNLGPTSWHKKAKRHLSDGGQPTATEQDRLGGRAEEEEEEEEGAFGGDTTTAGNMPWMRRANAGSSSSVRQRPTSYVQSPSLAATRDSRLPDMRNLALHTPGHSIHGNPARTHSLLGLEVPGASARHSDLAHDNPARQDPVTDNSAHVNPAPTSSGVGASTSSNNTAPTTAVTAMPTSALSGWRQE